MQVRCRKAAGRTAALATALRLSFAADWKCATGALVTFGLRPLALVLCVYGIQVQLDAVGRRDTTAMVLAAGFVAATTAVALFTGWLNARFVATLIESTSRHLDQQLMRLMAGVTGIEHYERPDYLERLELLRDERRMLADTVDTIGLALAALVRLVGTGVLLVAVAPVLVALPLLAVPSIVIGLRTERARQKVLAEATTQHRRAEHVYGLSTSARAATEIRVYGLDSFLMRLADSAWQRGSAALDRSALRSTVFNALGWLIFGLGYLCALALVLSSYLAGGVTLGQVVLTLTLMSTVNARMTQVVFSLTKLVRTLPVADRYRWLERYSADRLRTERARTTRQPPTRLAVGLSFRGVRFRYPGSADWALDGLTVDFPAGATVALVGENGSGKSTLVKLACQFHRPAAGRVELDGVDLDRIDPVAWRARVSALFQDFARLEFEARETVGAGLLDHIDDIDAVRTALRDADACSVVDDLPDKERTPLGRSFPDGSELSGGQWQRLSLARSVMRRNPLLLLLDEPTSAIDVDTEHALFTRYLAAAKEIARDSGAVTLVTAHRMSAVRLADLIVVLSGGRVVERGTHDELVAGNGLYAELFALQARAYR
ncbi:ABC transporter ATP-binding protein [Kutzneria sp. CA-103260]|uniref:ABC transporter ATP-binding protein n=1 Tax=Kutzneria sp. CA-103260 TaxID=2802641 RepID=UPI001BACD6CE|nr:ABC transporter ATP-binding protein [Kutzneria sp. CA-103260]QUQ65342.1 ABC transporter ATPase/permease [Kutzneria sp. CA-103260]